MISSEGDSEGQSTTAIPLYSIVNVPAMNEVKLDESIQLAASQGGLQWHGNPEALTTISDNQAAVIMDTQQQAVLTASNPQLQYVSLQQGLSGLQCTPTMQSQNNNCQNVGLGTVTHVVNPQKLEQTTVLSQHPQPQQQQNVVSQTTNASKMVANTGSAISSQKAEDKTKLNMFLEKEKQMKELLFPAKSNMSVSFPRADREPVPETVTANIINPSMPGRFIVTTPSAISYMLSPKNSNTNSPSLTPTLQAAFNAPILTQPLDVVSSKAPPMGDPVVMHLPGPSLTAVPSDVVAHVQPTGATSVLPSPAVSITNPRSVVNQPTRCDVSNALTNSKKHNSVTVVKSQRKISTPKKSKPSHGKDKGGASTSKTQSEDANSPSPNRQMKPKVYIHSVLVSLLYIGLALLLLEPYGFNPFTTEARFYVLNAIAFST